MRNHTLALSAILALALVATPAFAQAPGCDTGGLLAFTINGNGPDALSQVTVNPGIFADFEFIDGGNNFGIIFLLSISGVTCGSIPTPWAAPGGSVDLANPALVFDGVGFSATPFDPFVRSDFAFSLFMNVGNNPNGYGFQGVHQAVAPPFNFDNTVAIELVVPNIITSTVNGTLIPDDGAFQYNSFVNSIDLYGVTYNTFFVGSNGQVTFGAASGDFSPTLAEFDAGFQGTPTVTPNPGVAVLWADYNRGGMQGDYVVTEDLTTGTTKVDFQNQNWWDSQTPAGSFSVEFGALGLGSFVLDHSAALAGVAVTDQDPIIGVTDGNSAVGTNTTALAGLAGSASPGAPDTLRRQYLMAGTDPAALLPNIASTWLDIGGGSWTVF